MKIIGVDHWLIRVPFKEDILWGSGRRSGTTRLVVKITTDTGIVGWGETISLIEPVRAVFSKVVAPLAIGYSVHAVERFVRHVLGAGYYHHKRAAVMAIAAMEMAMWDALGKAANLPLYALWGGLWRDRVAACAYLFHRDPQKCSDKAQWFADQGYRTFKVKIGFDEKTDLTLVASLRKRLGDDAPLRADVNGAWFPGTARRLLRKMQDFDLAYVEQPLPVEDIAGHVSLRQIQDTPIALDESAYTLEDTYGIIHAGAADVVLLDPHEAGGLWQTIKAAGIAEAANIPVTLHSGAELGISQAAYLHLASSIPNMCLAIDTEKVYLQGDIVRNPPEIIDGAFLVPDGPGLGVEPQIEKIREFAVDAIEGAYLDAANPGWFPIKPSF